MVIKKALFVYNNFYPAWKAGGPVQSLTNLADALSGKMDIAVLCSAHDMGDDHELEEIKLHEWNDINGVKAYYTRKAERKYIRIKELMGQAGAEIIYLNGLYSLPFVVYPLINWHINLRGQSRLILAPRGMLHEGALSVKPFKKMLFLTVFKLLRLHRHIQWHATDEQEAFDIKKTFGKNADVFIAPNIPQQPVDNIQVIEKKQGQLRLVYLSLVTVKKNLLSALQWIKELNLPVIFEIYGPIKDSAYWEKCLQLINKIPDHIAVKYCGEALPMNVQATFLKYHALFLPTKGENFGHAIYECLSVGRPVIISSNTPWKKLEKQQAGFDIALTDSDKFKASIAQLFKMDQAAYDRYCNNALSAAKTYWLGNDFESAYLKMFN